MDPTATDQADLDYLLGGVGSSAGLTVPGTAAAAAVPSTGTAAALAIGLPPSSAGPAPTVDTAANATVNAITVNEDDDDDVVEEDDDVNKDGASTTNDNKSANSSNPNPKKRPLEDRKARDRKRILRNRQLARVSNERRKGRIKAMENELNETKLTVSTLEESIRCLEEENRELRNLLQGKSDGPSNVGVATVPSITPVGVSVPPTTAPNTLPTANVHVPQPTSATVPPSLPPSV